MIGGCTLAPTGRVTTAGFVQPVRKLIWPGTYPADIGGTTETFSRYDFPGVLVVSWAVNMRLLISGSDSANGSSVLFVMVTTIEADSPSGGRLSSAMGGLKSITL